MGLIGTFYLVLLLYGLGIIGLTVSEVRGARAGEFIFKPCLGLLFLIFIPVFNGLTTPYAGLIFAGLLCSFIGDLCLLRSGTGRAFLWGMGAFALAHMLYICALMIRFPPGEAILWFGIIASASALYHSWLFKRYLPKELKIPVAAYSFIITLMVCAAIFVSLKTRAWIFASAAILFAISDMAVAMHRFVAQKWRFHIIITPFYFIAQLLFAMSVGQ